MNPWAIGVAWYALGLLIVGFLLRTIRGHEFKKTPDDNVFWGWENAFIPMFLFGAVLWPLCTVGAIVYFIAGTGAIRTILTPANIRKYEKSRR